MILVNDSTLTYLSKQHDCKVAPQHAVADGRRPCRPKRHRGRGEYQSCRGEDGDGCGGVESECEVSPSQRYEDYYIVDVVLLTILPQRPTPQSLLLTLR